MARNDIVQPTITEYLDQLDSDKHGLVTFLNSVGLPSSDNDTFTVMIPKLQFVPSPIVDVGELGLKLAYSTWTSIDERFDFSTVTNFEGMFEGNSLISVTASLDTSSATNMRIMFTNCRDLRSIGLIDTSNVTSMDGMFNNCSSLISIPQFNTSLVSNMSNMFYGATALTKVPILNTSSITNFGSMFQNCRNLTDESLNNILTMCINASSYSGTKTLYQLGFRSNMYAASRIQALSNYNDFITAGWTIGY